MSQWVGIADRPKEDKRTIPRHSLVGTWEEAKDDRIIGGMVII
jgi:hypothetical protein